MNEKDANPTDNMAHATGPGPQSLLALNIFSVPVRWQVVVSSQQTADTSQQLPATQTVDLGN